jgi:hypothetical protein
MYANHYIQKEIHFFSDRLSDAIGFLLPSCVAMDGMYARQVFSTLKVLLHACIHRYTRLYVYFIDP